MENKALDNTDIKDVKNTTSDVKVFGDGDLFKLLSKASSNEQGWMKSTKAMFTGTGCVVQVTTQIRNADWSHEVAEAVTFVPNVKIVEDIKDGVCVGRHLEAL